MSHNEIVEALVSKGYTPFLADMCVKMLSDLEGRAKELSELTSIKFSIEVSL